jgi:hypothetical protein
MITSEEIEKTRSPRGLRLFVRRRIKQVNDIENTRHDAIQRRGIYKTFTDEIIPLSIVALKIYPNTYRVKPVLGSQGYDAVVKNEQGHIVDHVEITWPQNGQRKSDDARKIVTRGYGNTDVYSPGEDIDSLCSFILETCHKKAQKDYSDCTLVIVIDFVKPFRQHSCLYSQKLKLVAEQIKSINFKAKRVFLLILSFRRVYRICG